MPALGGTKTEQNLKDAFAGESQANRLVSLFCTESSMSRAITMLRSFSLDCRRRDRPRSWSPLNT